tara:strand:+ start:575 stop:895 length:321 start_codon:yes stop_codon:yes gene_type:complete
MDIGILKTLVPLALTAIAGLIAIVRLQSRAAENSKQLDMLLKDVARLESDQVHTTTLLAKMEQAERNVTQLWAANDAMLAKLERHRDRLDERYISLRDKINGGAKH